MRLIRVVVYCMLEKKGEKMSLDTIRSLIRVREEMREHARALNNG